MVTNIIKEEEDIEREMEILANEKYKNWEWKKLSDRKKKAEKDLRNTVIVFRTR